MSVKITDMTLKEALAGTELIPVSDAGEPKRITPEGLKSYIIDQIEAIAAGTAVTGANSVFVLQSGVLKPVDIDLVAQHAIDTIWGKTAETVADGADVIPLKDGGTTEKTLTLTLLATYIRTAIEAAILDVSDLAAAGTLSGADVLLVTQGTTGKKVTLTVLSAAVMAAFKAYLTALTAVATPADSDVYYVVQGGVEKKVTWATMKGVLGTVIAPATTTENSIPQWTSAQKTLKDGLTLQTSVRASGSAVDTAIPTEKAVRDILSGVEEVWVPAGQMNASTTAGCGSELYEYPTNDNNVKCLLFDGAAQDESAEFDLVMPPGWDRGTIKFKAYWAPGHADANTDEYISLALAAGAFSDDDALDAALGTPQSVTDQVKADDDLHITASSGTLTVGGTPALGDLIHFKVTRDYDYAGAGSAMDVDLRLIGILIQFNKTNTVAAW